MHTVGAVDMEAWVNNPNVRPFRLAVRQRSGAHSLLQVTAILYAGLPGQVITCYQRAVK